MTSKWTVIVAAIVSVACSKSGAGSGPWSWPSQVAPPFGLDHLRGGMTAAEARAAVPELVVSSRDGVDVLALPRAESTLVNVRLEGGRTADIVVRVSDCTARLAEMTRAWGPPRHVKELRVEVDVWADAESGWAGSVVPTSEYCWLVFTSKDYFGSSGTSPAVVDLAPPGSVLPASAAMRSESPGLFQRPVELVLEEKSRVISSVDLLLSSAEIAALHMRWGTGAMLAADREVWLDASHKRRAILSAEPNKDGHLWFEAYVPFDAWIGPSRTITSVPTGVLGSTLADLRAQIPTMVVLEQQPSRDSPDGSYGLRLPRTEWTRGRGTNAPLTFTADRVTRLSFDVPCRDREDCDAKQKLLDERWGTSADSAGARVYREGSTQIAVSQMAGVMTFTVSSIP